MKKIFLLLICTTSLLLSSCSGDDTKSGKPSETVQQGTVTVKIDGILKTYNTITLETVDYGENYTINCTASQNGSSAEMIQFSMWSDDIGADGLYNFVYTTESHPQNVSVSSNILVNKQDSFKATFSGQVFVGNFETGEGGSKPMTEGEINITY
jgi:hypothetical protein